MGEISYKEEGSLKVGGKLSKCTIYTSAMVDFLLVLMSKNYSYI